MVIVHVYMYMLFYASVLVAQCTDTQRDTNTIPDVQNYVETATVRTVCVGPSGCKLSLHYIIILHHL